jgi:membrane-associated protease RseP (regulator of RpoE activity)
MISNVRENSPASRAGLRAGDIIVDVDGKAVTNNLELMRAIGEKKEGDVQLTFVRDGNRQTVSVTPEAGKDGGFLYEFKNEDGVTPPAPGQQFKAARPATPPTPMVAPAPMTLLRPGRVI